MFRFFTYLFICLTLSSIGFSAFPEIVVGSDQCIASNNPEGQEKRVSFKIERLSEGVIKGGFELQTLKQINENMVQKMITQSFDGSMTSASIITHIGSGQISTTGYTMTSFLGNWYVPVGEHGLGVLRFTSSDGRSIFSFACSE